MTSILEFKQRKNNILTKQGAKSPQGGHENSQRSVATSKNQGDIRKKLAAVRKETWSKILIFFLKF